MTHLIPMSESAFATWLPIVRDHWLDNLLKAHRLSRDAAAEQVRAGLDLLLPQGIATPNNSLFEIVPSPDQTPVGALWLSHRQLNDGPALWVSEISILPQAQRQGHGRRTFRLIEAMARTAGISTLGLNVFSHNPGAYRLYESLGFRPTNTYMHRSLAAQEATPRGPGSDCDGVDMGCVSEAKAAQVS